ncbi:ribonuclease H [Trifolium pratense]|uniref:Ribonuclease H n=1 Tax=Trifolium pratense TaxID=57577 RepID=A0A2K3PJU5_TRIPR|nr:ribonuclease H [Trifolium pratense]
MVEGMQWSIGNGRTINFWSDRWLPSGIVLNNIVMQPIDPQIASKTVAYFSDNNGGWQLQEAVNMIPAYVIDQIQGCTAAADNLGEDRPSWPYSSNGVFAVKTAYDFLLSTRTSDRVVWKNIWKWEGPQKIKSFLYMAANETALHLLRDCELVRPVWQHFGFAFTHNEHEDMRSWEFEWQPVALQSRNLMQEISMAGNAYPHMERAFTSIQVGWMSLRHGWTKCNTDGAQIIQNQQAGCGGVFRDDSGQWLSGFSRKLLSAKC